MGFWAVVIGSVVLVFLWGLFSPRSQWKVLAAWSYRKPQADEPSGFAFAVHRVISGLGVVFFGAIGATGLVQYISELPPPPAPQSALQQMWGMAPEPQVVNRVVNPKDAVPTGGLVETSVDGYQLVENESHTPRYLHLLQRFEPSDLDRSGIVGVAPAKNFPALDSAELVVNVRTWGDCIPRQAVVIETETEIKIGFYVGMPNRQDDIVPDHLSCDRPAFVQNSLLVPINLGAPVEGRQVLTLDGDPIPLVEEIRK